MKNRSIERQLQVDRRRALIGIAAGGAGAALAFSGCVHQPTFRARLSGGQLTVPRSELAKLRGPVDALTVRSERAPIGLRRIDGAGFVAVTLLCTHRGCELSPQPQGYSCSCHGSRFGDAGELLEGPADRPLPRLSVRLRANGDLSIKAR